MYFRPGHTSRHGGWISHEVSVHDFFGQGVTLLLLFLVAHSGARTVS